MPLITFEGIEGSGKSSQVKKLDSLLAKYDVSTVVTREPGGTSIGEQIRSILMAQKNKELVPLAELLLYEAARVQHLSQVIEPAMNSGKTVLCDRYMDATIAYQGAGRTLRMDLVKKLNTMAVGRRTPDLTFIFDCPVETGLGRAWARIKNDSAEQEFARFEEEKKEFHQKVREGYLAIAKSEPQRCVIIDSSQNIEGTFSQLKNKVFETFPKIGIPLPESFTA